MGIEGGFHRFAYNDENSAEIPKWFKHEEDRHTKAMVPASKELVQMYRDRLKEINSRPIKKVAEAKARKKARTMKKLENIKGKAEKIANTQGASEREKILRRYQEKVSGKSVNPTKGKSKKGPVRFVDSRLKADKHNVKQKVKTAKRKGKSASNAAKKSARPQKVNKMRHMS